MIIFLKKKMEKKKPKVFIAMPCYDTMKVETCVSILNTYAVLAKSGVECIFKSVKSSLVTHARNLLTAGFMASEYDYMLFVDADVEFEATAVLRMLVPEKDIMVTPYRLKENPLKVSYPVEYPDPDNIKILPFDLVELKSAPAGLMLINRSVFRTFMEKYPEKKINFDEKHRSKMDKEVGYRGAIEKYMYNFWDTSFKDHTWKGEDLAFSELARRCSMKIYANLDSWTTHHGSWGFTGKFGDSLIKKEDK
jgi:hypothetical protein